MTDFANYNTSIPSLMSPTYSVGNAYSLNAGNYGMGYGTDGTVNSGYMGGMVTPMANVPVGQFNADYLVKNDNNKNNYYTRPIATFKKQDDTGTILGIGAAALATVALAVAACKGKAVKPPVKPPVIPDVTKSGNLPTVAPKYINRETLPANAIDKITSKDAILKGLNQPTNPGNLPAVVTPQVTPNNNPLAGLKYGPQSNPDARLMFSPALGSNGQQYAINALEKNPAIKTAPIAFNGKLAGVNIYATPLQQGAQGVQGAQQIANATQTGQKLLTYTPATQTGKLNLGPIESYLPQGNKGFTLPEQRIAGFLPSPQTVSTATQGSKFIKYPSGGARCNEHPLVTGDVLRAEFGNIGMNIDTKAFAALRKTNPDGQRYINDIVMSGAPDKLKAITCDPKYEHLFSVA